MKTLTLSALALALFFVQPLFATHGQCPQDCNCPYMQQLKGTLSLTPKQKTKIKMIKAQVKPALQKNQQLSMAVEEQITALTQSKTLDQSALNDLIKKKTALLAEHIQLKVNMRHQIYNILTPAQQAKFNEMEKNWQKK